jgi:hypothetical protein
MCPIYVLSISILVIFKRTFVITYANKMWRTHKDKIAWKKTAKRTYDPPKPTPTPTCLLWISNVIVTTMTIITYYAPCMKYQVNGWFDSLVWLLLWQKDWWKLCFSFQTDKASMLDQAIEYIKYLALQRCKLEQLGMVHQSSSKGISMIFCPSLPHVSLSVQLFCQSRKTFSSSKLQ